MAGAPATAIDVATRALARREFSAAELRTRLARAGFDAEEAEQAIAHLRDAGYQSDERTGRERARTLADRCLGDAAIIADLRRRGIPRELVNEILAELPSEPERAERLARRIGAGRRLMEALSRKGYSEDVVASRSGADIADDP